MPEKNDPTTTPGVQRFIPGSEVVEGSVVVPRKLTVSRMLESEDGDWVRFDDYEVLSWELEEAKKKREEWRGKAEHRLNEWRLRDADVQEAAATADEAEAAKEMWRGRAESAERRLAEAREALRQFMPTVRSHPAPDSDEIRSTGTALSRLHEAIFPEQYHSEPVEAGVEEEA